VWVEFPNDIQKGTLEKGTKYKVSFSSPKSGSSVARVTLWSGCSGGGCGPVQGVVRVRWCCGNDCGQGVLVVRADFVENQVVVVELDLVMMWQCIVMWSRV